MFGITDLVVGLWAVPVTLCIITPLFILVVWLLARLAKSIINGIAVKDKAVFKEISTSQTQEGHF